MYKRQFIDRTGEVKASELLGNGQVRGMTQHRLTLPFLSGVCDPVWNIFTCVRIINRKKRAGSRLRKMKFRVVLTEE